MSRDVDIAQPSRDFFFFLRENPRNTKAQNTMFVKDQLSGDNYTILSQ